MISNVYSNKGIIFFDRITTSKFKYLKMPSKVFLNANLFTFLEFNAKFVKIANKD